MRRINWWFWIPFIGGALLRCAWVWRGSLWYDENYTLAVIRLPWDGFITAIMGDVHPPLFYLLYRPMGDLAINHPWILRLPSVLISIASLPVAWLVFGQLANHTTQRAAFILFSLAATGVIFYAQEGRMYALLTLLLLLAVLAMVKERWILLGILAVALLYSQNYALLYLPSLWLAGVIGWASSIGRSTKILPLTLTLFIAFLFYLPWFPILIQQQANLVGGYWIPPFSPGVALIDLYHAVIQKGSFQMDVFGMVVFFGWCSYAAYWHIPRAKDLAGVVYGMAFMIGFGPWILAFLASLFLDGSIMHYRSLVPCVPFILLWLSYPLTSSENEKKTLNNSNPDPTHAGSKLRALPLA